MGVLVKSTKGVTTDSQTDALFYYETLYTFAEGTMRVDALCALST